MVMIWPRYAFAVGATFTTSCTLLVDTEFSLDAGTFGSDGGGRDASALDLAVADMVVVDPNACAVDLDCTARLGPRFRCARQQCFSLDAPCADTVRISEPIEGDQTWFGNTCYELAGTIFVRNGARLIIKEGTQITGLADSAALIVTRSGNITVNGTAEDPVVMTSAQPLGRRRPGDWGGLALLGRARINAAGGEDFLEGLPESEDSTYGGGMAPSDEYSCGTLQYLRIEFAGFELATNKELNGLTLGGCGFNTRIEHVQVHYGSDDGVEIFGGSVGLQWVVISRAQDDALDWDQGWRGWAQYVAILQDAPRRDLNANLYTGGDNGIEADSLSATDVGEPRSRPRLYNFTMIGSRGMDSRTRGMILREGTSALMRNFLVLNYPNGLWDIRDLTADCLRRPLGPTCSNRDVFALDGLVLHDMGPDGNTFVLPESDDNDGGFDEAAFVTTATTSRYFLLNRARANPNLIQPDLDGIGPLDLRPILSSPTNLREQNPPPYSDTAEQVQGSGMNYVGAFEPSGRNWMDGWTDFPRN